MKETKKLVWRVEYKDPNDRNMKREVISGNYLTLAKWLDRFTWVEDITTITLVGEITEIIEEGNDETR